MNANAAADYLRKKFNLECDADILVACSLAAVGFLHVCWYVGTTIGYVIVKVIRWVV